MTTDAFNSGFLFLFFFVGIIRECVSRERFFLPLSFPIDIMNTLPPPPKRRNSGRKLPSPITPFPYLSFHPFFIDGRGEKISPSTHALSRAEIPKARSTIFPFTYPPPPSLIPLRSTAKELFKTKNPFLPVWGNYEQGKSVG